MAVPTTKATFKSYCLRALGFGVIDINISDDQADDRIDEALQYFSQYHYDGIFPFSDTSSRSSLFDVRYQLRLNDLYDFSSQSVIHYEMTMKHLDFLEHILVGETPIRFNQHQNRLYIDADWQNDFVADQDYLVIECYRKLDPDSYTDVYDDIYLKRYATALLKRQWGANLSKFSGVAMLGGVTMNGETIFSQAQEELQRLEEQIQLAYELPVNYMIG